MNKPMVSRVRLIFMNIALAAAILYRWLHGANTMQLVILGIILFPLFNALMYFAAKNSALSKK